MVNIYQVWAIITDYYQEEDTGMPLSYRNKACCQSAADYLCTDQMQCQIWFSSHMSGSCGNIGIICQPKEADGEVSEGSHHSGAGLGSYLRAILIEGDVPDIVAFVFDAPMPAVQVEELLG